MVAKLTTETFVAKARKVHGDRYDYSKTEYTGALKPVTIICRKHGEFVIRADNHIGGYHCRQCLSDTQRKSTSQFVTDLTAKYTGKYTVPEDFKYKTAHTPITIICAKHGLFETTANRLLSGHECPKCKGGAAYDKDKFVELARKVHGDKYDYSQLKYINIKAQVKIICPIHGEFWQTPDSHLRGCGCQMCSREKQSLIGATIETDKTSLFITKARKVHGDRYDYNRTVYTGALKPLVVTCKNHGDFTVRASIHLEGYNCRKCLTDRQRKSTPQFIEDLKVKYNGKYTVAPSFEYKTAHTPMMAMCADHGLFETTPNRILAGHICPSCAGISTFVHQCNGKMAKFYIVQLYNKTESFYKVGVTSRSLAQRLNRFHIGGYNYTSPIEILLDAVAAAELEINAKDLLKEHRYYPTSLFAGHTECFTTIDPIKHLLPTVTQIFDIRALQHILNLTFTKHGYDARQELIYSIIEYALYRSFDHAHDLPSHMLPDDLHDDLYIAALEWLEDDATINNSHPLMHVDVSTPPLFILKYYRT